MYFPAGRRKPPGQILFDTAATLLTLILHVSDHCNYNKHDVEYDIPPEDTLHFTMCYRKLHSCLNVISRAIYQNKHSYFLGTTPIALVFTAGTAAGYQQGFQSR